MKYVGNGSSLPVLKGDSLHLVCLVDSNPPATLSWAQGSQTLSPSQPSDSGVLELPRVESEHEGEFTCRAQHPQGSLSISLHLSVHCEWEDGGHLGAGHLVLGRGRTPLTFSLPQILHSCWGPPAPGRKRGCTAAAPPEPSRPPLCTGGWGRGCWKGTSAMPPSMSPSAQQVPGPTAP